MAETLRIFPVDTKRCSRCSETKTLEQFSVHKNAPDGRHSQCRECRNAFQREKWNDPAWKDYFRDKGLQRRFGITVEDFDEMARQQGFACAICQSVPDVLCVDHCHKTNRVRQLLCRNCNLALGYAKDDPETLRAMAEYLEAHHR